MSSHESQAAERATLTHFDLAGRARMVDVGEKPETERVAIASGRVRMAGETIELIRTGRAAKGDVLAVAQVAAVMGAKKNSRSHPDVPPTDADSNRRRLRAGTGRSSNRGNSGDARPHRGRDGGADRGRDGRADDLRHVEGG